MKLIFWVCLFLVLLTMFVETEAAPNGKVSKNAPGKSKVKAKSKKPSRGKTSKKGRKREGEEGGLEIEIGDLVDGLEGSGSGDDMIDPEEEGDDGDSCMQCLDPCGCFGWGSKNDARKNAKKRNSKKRTAKKRQTKQKQSKNRNSKSKAKPNAKSKPSAKSNKKQG